MVRLYGRGPRGERVIDDVPQGTWKTITFVAALRHNKMVAPMVFDGPMTGQMFLAYVEQCLAPTLKRNDIVVIDNLRAHKVAGVREECPTANSRLSCAGSPPGLLSAASSYSLLHPPSPPSRMCQLLQAFR